MHALAQLLQYGLEISNLICIHAGIRVCFSQDGEFAPETENTHQAAAGEAGPGGHVHDEAQLLQDSIESWNFISTHALKAHKTGLLLPRR